MVSFFMMTAMWASILEAYKIYVTADAAGKTYGTAELTLNMKNKVAIGTWSCTLELPTGVTFVSAELLTARVPEGYDAEFVALPNEDGSKVEFSCEGAAGVALTGTDGAVATVTVAIAGDAPLGDCIVNVKDASLMEPNGDGHNRADCEFTWTIEEGEAPQPSVTGDLTGDGKVAIGDAISVLNVMAAGAYERVADLNQDGVIDIKDFIAVLNIIAAQ